MADAQANINVNLDATRALAQLKNLQRQIATFNAEIARGGAQAAAGAARMQQNMVSGINATGQFSATMVRTRTTTESFTNSLEKNKFSMRQYFRNAGGATKKFGHLFSKEMGVIDKVARERVKTLQTQYVTMGRDASGAMKSIAVRPLALDMKNVATQTAIAAQKQQIFNGLLRQGSTNLLNWGKNTQWAGRQLMVGFTIPLAIFGAAASSSFMKLEEQAIKFKRVYGDLFTTPQQADEAFDDMAKLGAEFTKFGVSVEETLGLAAKAAQMGNMGADLTAQVTEATRLSILGGMGQEEALDTTVSLTNAFGVATEDLTEKINFLNAAENQTILSMQDFNIAVPKAGSVVAQLGGDVEDLAFFLTAMREGGVNASQGANALKSSLGRLINPTQRAKDALSAYGIDVVGIVEANQGNLRETVLQLGGALDELDPLEKARAIETLFGKFQFARMSAMFQNIMDEGSQAATVLDLINTESGELSQLAGRELGRVEESAATKFRSAVEQFQVALAPIGESFVKLITPVIEFGTKILNAFNNMSDGAKSFVVGLIGILGGIGPILLMTIGLVANGIANLFGGFLNLREGMMRLKGESTTLGQQTQYMTQEQLEAASVASSLSQTHNSLTQTFTSEKAAVDNLVASYSRMIGVQQGALGTASMGAASGGATKAKGFRYGKKVPGYQEGIVMVPGRKGEGDTQPAMLAPGEAVIPAKMAEKYGPLINGMIEGSIPGYKVGRGVPGGSERPVASHFDILSPKNLSSTLKDLGNAGKEVTGTLYRLQESADGTSIVVDRLEGSMVDLVRSEENLMSGGGAFAGTTKQESSARNAMYESVGIAGAPFEMDSLIESGNLAEQEQRNNTKKYQAHSVEIDRLIQESKEAQQALSKTNDQYQLKLNYMRENTRAGLLEAELQKKGITREQAEANVDQKLLEIDKAYAALLQQGLSKEQALQKAKEQMIVSLLKSGSGEFSSGPRSLGTDPLRAYNAGKTRTSGDTREISRTFEGRKNPIAGSSAAQISKKFDYDYRLAGQQIVRNAAKQVTSGVKQATKQASPSKEAAQAGRNIGIGAIQGIRENVDDSQAAGRSVGQAAVSGIRSGTGTGKTGRRVTVPGPITPTAAVGEVAAKTKNFGRSMEKATIKVAGMGAKIGMAGIGVSSLVGGLSMVEGPLGDFASKLFPLTSLVTGLSFAFQMLTAETIKGFAAKVTERKNNVLDVISLQKSTAAQEISTISEKKSQKVTELNTLAEKRSRTVTNRASRAVTAFTAILNKAAATAGVAGSIGLQRATRGTPLLGTATAVGAKGAAAAGATGAAAVGAGNMLKRSFAPIFNVYAKSLASVSKISVGLGAALSKLGAVVGSVLKGIGGVMGAILGVSSTVALVIAGLALLAGGIFLLVKVMNDQKAKIAGLGDAADISAEKLNSLSEGLGVEASGARAATIESATSLSSEEQGSSLAGGTFDSQQEILEVRESFLKLMEDNKDFRKEWKGTVSALKDGSQEAAQASMEMLAVSLQTEGYTKEQIQGVVSGLLQEAGRTDVKLDFANLNITTQEGALDTAAENLMDSVEKRVGVVSAENSIVVDDSYFSFDEAALDQFASSLSSSIVNLNAQFDQGMITLSEYEAGLEGIRQKLLQMANEGPEGVAAANEVARRMIAELEAAGMVGIEDRTAGLLDLNTGRGAVGATTVAQAQAAGVSVSDEDISRLEKGAEDDATAFEQIDYSIVVQEIEAATEAQKDLNREAEEKAIIDQKIKDLPDQLSGETQALIDQADTYKDVYADLEDNAEIKDKAGIASKIAADEVLRLAYAEAVAADAANDNTEATEAFFNTLQEFNDAEVAAKVPSSLADLERETNELNNKSAAYDILRDAGVDADLAIQGVTDAAIAQQIVLGEIDLSDYISQLEAIAAARKDFEGREDDAAGGRRSGGGGSKEDPTSFLDDIVKKYRDFGDSSQELTKGFDASLEAIMGFAKGGSWGLNGLSRQLRNVNISETLIEKFLGMEPEEWEKTKGKLFKFDEEGQISGLTEQGEAVQQADASATIAEETDSLDSQTKSAEDQLAAFKKLRDQGAGVALAYEMIQNKNIASAVATSKNTAEVKGLIKAQRELKELEEEIEEIDEEEQRKERIREAIKNMNKEFDDQVKALNKVRKATDKYSDAQIKAIFGNKDLRSLFLEPNIDKRSLQKALDNAEKQAQLELDIKLLTFEGREDFLNEAFKKAKDKLSNEETKIELEFDAEVKGQEDIIRNAQNEIDSLTHMISGYQAALDEVQFREDEINEKYDKRFEALDKIATINDRIAQQQKNQLSLAEALSKGDIAAAAQAAQTMREQEMKDNTESQREMMEMRQKAELESVKSLGGMTRDQLEDQIDSLNRKVSSIEQQRLEPAEEYIRLAEIRRDREIENLEVLGRTSTQWDEIQNALDVARTRNFKFMNEMQEQFNQYPEILAKYLEGEPLPPPPALPEPPPTTRSRSSGRSRLSSRQKRENANAWKSHVEQVRSGRQKPHSFSYPNQVKSTSGIRTGAGAGYAYGGLVARMALGGAVRGGMFTNMAVGGTVPYRGKGGSSTRMATGGNVKGYPMGGLIPYKNAGGMFKSLGSDTIPAMLTPGEFVVRRPAVSGFGIENLEKINRGTYNDGSMYNYNLSINVKSDSNPEQIANTVMRELKRVDSQRIRNNRY